MSENRTFSEVDDRELNHAEIDDPPTRGVAIATRLVKTKYWLLLICAATYVIFQFGISAEWSAVIAILVVGPPLIFLKVFVGLAFLHKLTTDPSIQNESDDPDINKLSACPNCRRLVSVRCRVCPKCDHRFSR